MVSDDPRSRQSMSLTFKLKLAHPPRLFVLEAGGTTLPPFHAASHFLIDRNILGMIRRLAAKPERTDFAPEQWAVGLLGGQDIQLNAVLAALEGDGRKVPTMDELALGIREGTALLRAYYPQFVVHDLPVYAADAQRELLLSYARDIPKEVALLVEAGPFLANRRSFVRVEADKKRILDMAAHHKVPSANLLVITMLSCLLEFAHGTPPSPARLVLKPRIQMMPEQAYNAVADLRALELLAAASQWTGGATALLTRDRGLARLWDLLGIVAVDPLTRSATARPKPGLFERLDEAGVHALLAELTTIEAKRLCDEAR